MSRSLRMIVISPPRRGRLGEGGLYTIGSPEILRGESRWIARDRRSRRVSGTAGRRKMLLSRKRNTSRKNRTTQGRSVRHDAHEITGAARAAAESAEGLGRSAQSTRRGAARPGRIGTPRVVHSQPILTPRVSSREWFK